MWNVQRFLSLGIILTLQHYGEVRQCASVVQGIFINIRCSFFDWMACDGSLECSPLALQGMKERERESALRETRRDNQSQQLRNEGDCHYLVIVSWPASKPCNSLSMWCWITQYSWESNPMSCIQKAKAFSIPDAESDMSIPLGSLQRHPRPQGDEALLFLPGVTLLRSRGWCHRTLQEGCTGNPYSQTCSVHLLPMSKLAGIFHFTLSAMCTSKCIYSRQ